MLNESSRLLGNILNEVEEDETPLSHHLAAAKKVQKKIAKKTPPKAIFSGKRPSAKKPGFLDKFFGLGGKALATAHKFGLPLPLDSDMAGLQNRLADLKDLSFQMDDILSKAVPRLYAMRKAEADLLAQSLTTKSKQAKAQAVDAIRQIDNALAAAKTAQAQVASGKPRAAALGGFTVKKAIALRIYTQAKLRLDQVVSSWQAGERSLVGSASTLKSFITGAPAAAAATAYEFGSRAVSAAKEVGEVAEEAARGAGAGAHTAAGLLKYWPVIALGGAGLFIYTSAPKTSISLGRSRR